MGVRKWIFAVAVFVLVGTSMSDLAAPAVHNLRYLHLAKFALALEQPTAGQLRAVSDQLEGRRAAIWLVAMATRLGRQDLTVQIAVLDWIQLRNLYPYLLPDEAEQIIRIRSYQNELLYAEGRFTDVSVQADKMLALVPDSAEGLVWKAAALGRLDQSSEAGHYFERAIRSYPDSVLVLTKAAYYYIFWSPDRAWEYKAWPLLGRALSLDARNETALWLASVYLMDEGRCSEALVLANRNAGVNSNDPNPWRILGDVYWCLGSKEMARASYERAILLSPSLEPYLKDRLVQP